jgi:CheY-like chemotaxis protein
LPGILKDAERILLPLARDKGLQLSVRLASPIPSHILTDAVRLSQIVINLAGNAIKFTDDGAVNIIVGAQDEGTQLRIDIEDTGIGIDDALVDQLFTPFTQVDMSVTRRHGGTGLGLSISRKLAQLLGGDVTLLRSACGVGSTFRIIIPLRRCRATVDVKQMDERAVRLIADPSLHMLLHCRILLAEDSPENQRFLATVLRKAGANVTLASNGGEALELVAATEAAGAPYDMLITDVQMPILDGLTLAKELRQRGSTLPIIALTAHAMEDDRQRCFEAGCNDFASKPISRATLIDACSRWLPNAEQSSVEVLSGG